MTRIQKLAAAHMTTRSPQLQSGWDDNLIGDFLEGAARNPRLGFVQFENRDPVKLGADELVQAEIYGSLEMLAEAQFTLKEASAYLAIPSSTLAAIIEAAR